VPRDHRSPSPPPPTGSSVPEIASRVWANFGKPNGEFGTVESANDEDAIVKWDDDRRIRIHQPSLKKI